jgi:hypothetical protein
VLTESTSMAWSWAAMLRWLSTAGAALRLLVIVPAMPASARLARAAEWTAAEVKLVGAPDAAYVIIFINAL